MKKVFLALALAATVMTSCNKVTAPASVTEPVQVDSVSVDSVSLDTTQVDPKIVDTITPKC